MGDSLKNVSFGRLLIWPLEYQWVIWFFAIFTLLFGQIVDAKTNAATIQLRNASNTDRQCVSLAREVLQQDEITAEKSIPQLITCLAGEYYYFEKGAAKITLAHIGKPSIPLLIKALNNTDNLISEGAIITLGLIGPEAQEAVPVLKKILRQKPKAGASLSLPRSAAQALGKIGEIDFLIRVLEGKEANIQPYFASHGLGAAGSAAAPAIPVLMEALKSSNGPTQMYAADALGAIGTAANPAVPRLSELSKSSLNFVRRAAGEALIKIGTPDAKEAAKSYELRKNIFETFFKVMSVFVAMPYLALVLGLCLAVAAFATARNRVKGKFLIKMLYVPAIAWIMYAAWEYYSTLLGANIRVDLLFIYPIMAIITMLGLLFWFIGVRQSKSDSVS